MKKILPVLILVFAFSCKEKVKTYEANQARLVTKDNLQVAFEWSTMQEHMKMMKKMNITEMNHRHDANRVLMVTLSDIDKKQTVTEAKVKFQVKTPGGETLEPAVMTMSGSSMFHFASMFNARQKGAYDCAVEIEYAGKTYRAEARFGL